MTDSTPSPVAWVRVMQALVARELVESFGLPERRTAELLGIVPSAVSQYLSGKRLGRPLSRPLQDPTARALARRTAQAMLEGSVGPRRILEAAATLAESGGARRGPAASSAALSRPGRAVPRWFRRRVAGEQDAVTECMRLARRSRDEMTRAVFRQIASDSLRHAEIVASLASYLDRGITAVRPTGVSRADIDGLLRRERAAEASDGGDPAPELGGVLRILWESMEADERKHELLLSALRAATPSGYQHPRRTRPGSARRPP